MTQPRRLGTEETPPTSGTEQPLRTAMLQASRALDAGDTGSLGEWCLDTCSAALPSSEVALVELGHAGQPVDRWAVTASADAAHELCELDLYTHAGPCRSCLARGGSRVVPDVSRPPAEWRRFAGRARDRGYAWSSAQPLFLGGSVIGALQIFGTTQELPAEEALELSCAVAQLAAALRLQENLLKQLGIEVSQLHTALDSRLVIEQAKGVLAARHGIGLEQSFDRLRAYARSHHRNIHELARDVIDGQDIPDPR